MQNKNVRKYLANSSRQDSTLLALYSCLDTRAGMACQSATKTDMIHVNKLEIFPTSRILLKTRATKIPPPKPTRNLAIANRSRVSCAKVVEMTVKTQSTSSEMPRFDRPHTISCYRSIITTTLSCIVSHIQPDIGRRSQNLYPTCI